ncbi:MAG: hypothetical protein HYR55_15545 [Acidobacteria bacterium]|nr:hypothetical protein [Acidobacteriota bacterium]MBI3658209.1 hypothetical protein [Acidobacteriota bacterium]
MEKKSVMLMWLFLPLAVVCCGISTFAMAEQLNALGQLITQGSVAYIDNNPIPSGTMVMAGDKIRAINAPALISLTGGGRVELSPNTQMTMAGQGQALQITQTSGKSRVHVPRETTLTMITPKATVTTLKSGQGFTGTLTVESTRVTFVSEKGEFTLTETESGKTRTVPEGESATVGSESESASATRGSGVPSAKSVRTGLGRSKAAWWTVGVVGAGATAGAVAGVRSSDKDVNPPVSPSRP